MQLKTILATLILFTTLHLNSAPGDVHKGTLTLVWDPPASRENIRGYKLWVTTNLPPGMPLPIPKTQTLLSMRLPAEGTNTFTPFMEIPGDATSVTLTNIWSQLGTWAFFVLTATNEVGESPFSNPAALVAPLSGRGGLSLRLDP